ncbi:MAG TPA: Gfo/Idh/MocA family oxidoreductase [Gemmatimonadaceae bacterium]|nr:Gfo/Idh/MocA family oxidoreductase [Gemmatimonadaceae bacterium]
MAAGDDLNRISRRTFVREGGRAAAALAIAPMIVPRHVLGGVGYRAPSRTLNVACVGIGGMGMVNMNVLVQAGENIVAVCDADFAYVERSLAGRLRPPQGQSSSSPESLRLKAAYEKAAKYEDFRVMLERQKDIDAVVIATPDHLHGIIANAAMKAGKHVYVQKPLTYSVYEARLLARTARETKVVTQMGNQGHSQEGTRRIHEIVRAGVIGPVREVHVWTDRPQRYWAQGIPRPARPVRTVAGPVLGAPAAVPPTPPVTPAPAPAGPPVPPRWGMRTVDNAILRAMAENPQSPPPGLRWDLFLGPAPDVPYHPVYHPFSWRGWPEFGVSAIGDMGAHLLDQPFWALDLGYPTSVIASSTPWGGTPANPGAYPLAMTARYEFAARGAQPAVTLTWYDGGLLPALTQDIVLPRADGGGGVMIGEQGYLTYETYGENLVVYPEAAAARAASVPRTLPRIEVPHEVNWAQACKGEAAASCPFEYAAPLTEVMLLGVAALRAGQSRRILYDGAGMSITNIPEANAYLTREFRAGWFPG